MDWGFVTDRLANTFRRERWIGAHERRFLAEVLFGLVRHARRVDTALALGRVRPRDVRDLDRVFALLLLDGLVSPDSLQRVRAEVAWRQVMEVDAQLERERDPVVRLGLAHSLPDWLSRRLLSDWGDAAWPLAAALNQRAPMTVRVNTLVATREALRSELAEAGLVSEPGAWSSTALIATTRTNLFASPSFRRGAMEAQDEGSQLLAELATPPSPGNVVDYCAGAGGKTLAIAAGMRGQGRVLAADVDGKKLEELRRRARRAQLTNTLAVTLQGEGLPRQLTATLGRACRVLVDAPCSGIGALRRNPEARWRLQEADVDSLVRQQAGILGNALPFVAKNGLLVYATCSLLRAENEGQVESLLSRNPELELVPLTELWGNRAAGFGDGTTFTARPDLHGTDGFFAAVFRKRSPL